MGELGKLANHCDSSHHLRFDSGPEERLGDHNHGGSQGRVSSKAGSGGFASMTHGRGVTMTEVGTNRAVALPS
jgi:hypothetical protein